MRTNLLGLSFFLPALLSSASAFALTQPDNTPIPVGSGLQDMFTSRGEAINALNDAATTPETFIPSCALTFTVLQRNAGYKNSFGWYNVTGNKPTPADLHEFLTCNDGVGTVKVLDIKNDPGYAGGEIAFYQATGACATPQSFDYLFFSEKKYNPDGNQSNPFIHLLIYNSTVTAKAFYFGWEDLLSGGDNDFDDLTTFVTGISCSGGGGACQTGQQGICADGIMQCQGGVLTCVQSNAPASEKCDGLDNDCNGSTDEGDICPAGQVCDKGTCVPKCGSGEFKCSVGEVCSTDGLCVDPACQNVSCPAGERCVKGQCQGPCDGVVCPHGQVCRVGACVDPCVNITCDSDQVCLMGACTEKCQCSGCPTAQTCMSDGTCMDDACTSITCPMGQYCLPDGSCVDACAGASCPAGEVCDKGQCVPGSSSGPTGAGGSVFASGVGGSTMTGATGGMNGAGGASGTGGTNGAGGAGNAGDSGGCGCHAAGEGSERGVAALGLALLGLLAGRRRRR